MYANKDISFINYYFYKTLLCDIFEQNLVHYLLVSHLLYATSKVAVVVELLKPLDLSVVFFFSNVVPLNG